MNPIVAVAAILMTVAMAATADARRGRGGHHGYILLDRHEHLARPRRHRHCWSHKGHKHCRLERHPSRHIRKADGDSRHHNGRHH